MVAIPFIYFTLLTAYWWKKHQCFDLCVFMSILYAVTSFLAICIVVFDILDAGGILFDAWDLELNILPTVVYCAVLTIGMLPFSMIYKKELETISTPNPRVMLIFSCFLIGVSFLNFYLVADSTLDILQGDLAAVRDAHMEGLESPAQLKAETMPFIIKFIYYFNYSTILAVPLFFYYLCFEKRPWWFKALLLFASLSMPIAGVQSVDRTEPVFYGMMFLSCLILFYKHLSIKTKRIIYIITIPLSLILLIYVTAVSEARFGEREGGATTGAVQYAGQGYLNFCFFWENGKRDIIAAEREFPLLHHYLLHIDNNDERRNERTGQQGFWMSVFATYLGDVLLDLSPIGMFIWLLFFFIITTVIIKRPHRTSMSLGEFLAIFVLSAIPIFGVFYYRYMYYMATYMILLVAALYTIDKFKIKLLQS